MAMLVYQRVKHLSQVNATISNSQSSAPAQSVRDEILSRQEMGVSLNGGTPKTPQNDHF